MSLAKIKLIFTNVIVIIIAKREIKNFKEKGVIYIILTTSKYKILPKSREVTGYLLNNIIPCLAYLAIIICYCGIICFHHIITFLYRY